MKSRTPSSWSKSLLTLILFFTILYPVNLRAQSPCSSIRIADEVRNVRCAGVNDGRIKLQIRGGSPPYRIEWDHKGGTGWMVSNLSSGVYRVTVTDQHNCRKTREFRIGGPNPMNINSRVLTGDGDDRGQLEVSVRGGADPYRYFLFKENGPMVGIDQERNIMKGVEPGNYLGVVVDARGCTKSFRVTVR